MSGSLFRSALPRLLFSKLAIFSVDFMIISKEIETGDSVLYLSDERKYVVVSRKLPYRKSVTMKNGSMVIREFDDFILKKDAVLMNMSGKPLENLKEVKFHPMVIPLDGRLYHLLQYTSKENEFVTRRLMELNHFLNKMYGRNVFRIERITDFSDPYKSLEELGAIAPRFSTTFSFKCEDSAFYSIQKNSPASFDNAKFLVEMDGVISLVDWDTIIPSLGEYAEPFSDLFKNLMKSFIIPDQIEVFSESGNCTVRITLDQVFRKLFEKEVERIRHIFPDVILISKFS